MKLLRRLLLVLFAALVLFNAGILIFGKTYFYTAISKTYLSGQSGPGIYDLDKFPYRTIRALRPEAWPFHSGYNTSRIGEGQNRYLESIDTRAFVVIKDGQLFFEKYWDGHSDTVIANSFSVTKSITALLAQFALQDGYIASFGDPLGKYVREFSPEEYPGLRLEHLMSMSSGLRWTESGGNPFSDNAEAYYGTDLVQHVTRRMKPTGAPGKEFIYKSGNTQLLGMAVERATGMPLSRYAEIKLWKKLNAEHPAFWSMDNSKGMEKAYCCFYATARDFARIGQLMLQQGNWKGEQLLDSGFVAECRTPAALRIPDNSDNVRYSMRSWWLLQYKGSHYFYARGILGQYILVLPEQRAVVVRIGVKRSEVDAKGHPGDVYQYIDIANELLK